MKLSTPTKRYAAHAATLAACIAIGRTEFTASPTVNIALSLLIAIAFITLSHHLIDRHWPKAPSIDKDQTPAAQALRDNENKILRRFFYAFTSLCPSILLLLLFKNPASKNTAAIILDMIATPLAIVLPFVLICPAILIGRAIWPK